MPCDVLSARDGRRRRTARHFVGYGGAEIFGRIPHFTENRFMKWYKGVLSQFFGDLGPFTTGMTLALLEKLLKGPSTRRSWRILVDGQAVAAGRYPGADHRQRLPRARHALLGRRAGLRPLPPVRPAGPGHPKLLGQARRARDGSIMQDAARWGMEHIPITGGLTLETGDGSSFPFNVDGSTLACRGAVTVQRVDSINLIARLPSQSGG